MSTTLWLAVVIAVVAVVVLWFRLGGGKEEASAARIPSRPFSEGGTGSPSAGLSADGIRAIEAYVRDHIVEIAERSFPDNPGLRWIIHGFQPREDLGLVFAEVEPRPDEVGYSRFQFVFSAPRSDSSQPVAAYCLDDGVYTLLFTSPGAPEDLPQRLD